MEYHVGVPCWLSRACRREVHSKVYYCCPFIVYGTSQKHTITDNNEEEPGFNLLVHGPFGVDVTSTNVIAPDLDQDLNINRKTTFTVDLTRRAEEQRKSVSGRKLV